jgi:hypothetical protein
MSRDLGLRLVKDLDKVANANLLLSHEIQEPQASVVTQSLKEPFQAECLLCWHVLNISALTDIFQEPYIRIHGCEENLKCQTERCQRSGHVAQMQAGR